MFDQLAHTIMVMNDNKDTEPGGGGSTKCWVHMLVPNFKENGSFCETKPGFWNPRLELKKRDVFFMGTSEFFEKKGIILIEQRLTCMKMLEASLQQQQNGRFTLKNTRAMIKVHNIFI